MNINPHTVTQLFQNTVSQLSQDDGAHIYLQENNENVATACGP